MDQFRPPENPAVGDDEPFDVRRDTSLDQLQPLANPAIDVTVENNDDPIEEPNAPQRSAGPENGVKDKPPPKFSETDLQEPSEVELEELQQQESPRPEDEHIEEERIEEGTNESVPSTGMELTASPEMPPPKKRRRKMGKLRIDKTTQIEMKALRDQRMNCSDQMFSETDIPDCLIKDANILLQNNFPLKNKSSKLNQMLKQAAGDEKFFEDIVMESNEESEEEEEEIPHQEEIPSVEDFDRSRSGLRAQLDPNLGTSRASSVNPSVRGSTIASHITLNIPEDIQDEPNLENIPEENQENVIVDEPLGFVENIEAEGSFNRQRMETSQTPEGRFEYPEGSFEEMLEANVGYELEDWSKIYEKAAITNRRQAAKLFEVLLTGIKERKYHGAQEDFFGKLYVKKL